ncbi:hypothetical protein V8F20_007345 [Naviculisporaceae sp. PSN 640]
MTACLLAGLLATYLWEGSFHHNLSHTHKQTFQITEIYHDISSVTKTLFIKHTLFLLYSSGITLVVLAIKASLASGFIKLSHI